MWSFRQVADNKHEPSLIKSNLLHTSRQPVFLYKTMKLTAISFALLPTLASAGIRSKPRHSQDPNSSTTSVNHHAHRELLFKDLFDKWIGRSRFSKCTETRVLIAGVELFTPDNQYSQFTYDVLNEPPSPFDREVYNLRLYEPEPFIANPDPDAPEQVILGFVNEELVYLPPADFPSELDCLGHEIFTFFEPGTDNLTGQVSDQYTCFGQESLITGGSLSFACAEGKVIDEFKTDDFFDGAGYAIFNIVDCGMCDSRHT